MSDFRQLKIWQEAHRLTLMIYKLTDKLPKSELFILVSQIRRAAISVESNIAEGEGRYHKADRLKFFVDARASIKEVQTQLLIIRDLYKALAVESEALFDEYEILSKRITSLINYRRANN